MATSLASDLSAIEITKVSAFVNFLEKNAPVIGDAATYTKNLAKGVQDQITQSGSCAFVGVFDQAKDVVPQLAMEGFAHAQGFTEYLVQKAPQVFSIGGKNPGLEIISTIQAQAPAAFETAHQVGSQAAGFVSQGGAAVFDQIKQFGGVISFLQNVHPEILASISPTLAIDFESVNAVKSGVTAAASAVAPAAKETASAMKDFASVAAPLVSSDLASAASAVGGFAASAASTIGNAFANIDAASIAQGTEVALNVIGSAAAVFPFLLPVQIALKDIGNAVQQATYNKESAEILKVRCTDCAKLISEMAPKIAKIAPSEAEQVAAVTPFVNAINEATEFLKKFSSRNFLMHMISWKREGRDVMFVDKKITDTLQNLSMRVNGYQVEIQVNTNQKVDQIMNMLNSIDLSQVKEPKDIAPEKLIEIIKAAGAESTEEIKKQMEFIGVQLEEVTKAINNLNENLSNVSQTITILSEQLTSNARDNEAIKDALVNQKENNDFMKDFLIQSVSTINQENTLTLNEIKNLILSGGGGSGKHELEVYCDLHKAAYLSTKANDVKQRVPHIILIHPHGVGFESYESLNGTDGANGRAGVSQQKARAGMHGNAATGLLNGADGEDGEDGGDGEHAEDAENGVDAGSFEVMIIFQKENKQAGTRTYRIEHSGPHGKIEEDIDIPIFNSMILIDGAGGRGGKGGDGGRGGDGGAGGDGGNAAHGNDRDREGGDGGNGGSGGEGGEGGEPGNGGNGGNGASIIVRTNDITILPMIEVDVSGGKGGFAGLVGAAGEGGLGGNPGEGGQGGVYFDGQTQRQGARGRRGKAGKKGKKGKSKQKKKSSAGTDGKLGKVSFCVYDDTGFKESGGTPYRTMIQKKDIPNLTPMPLNYGIPSTDRLSDPFVYGQMLQLGPVLPINIGSIYSPALQFIGRLVAHRILHTTSGRDLNKVSMLKFPPIPGEKSTRYGELQKNLAQSLKIDLPSLKELGLTLSSSSESWPWKPHYEKVPRSYSTFTFVFAFNGIVQKASVVDKDHVCRLDYTLNVEVPLEIISYQYGANPAALADVYSRSLQERKSQVSSPRTILTAGKIVNPSPELDFTLVQGGDAISAPRSILWHPSTMGFKISTFLYNRLQNTDFNKTNLARVVITVAGHHCYTNITNVSKGLATSPRINSSDGEIFAELPVDPKHDGFQRSSLISAVPYLPKGSSKELEFQLQINTKQKKPSSNDEIVVPAGTRLFVREELMYDEAIIEITPSHVVRIAPPWPPVTTTSPDILLFTDSTYTIKDFQIISQITQTLDLHIAFFDYEHFFSPNNNIQLLTIPPANRLMRITALPWESYLGKLTIAWFPTTNEFAAMANQPDFINHIKKSGGFMNGTCSNTVNPIQIPNELNNFLAKEMRNVVKLPNNFSIHSLKETNTDFSISSDRITGQPSILQYLIAIFITMKFEKKLQYLFANESKNILNIVVSTKIQLTDYQTEIDAGCCSCCSGKKSKVLPAKKSGLTIRDILLVAIRTELMMDLGSLPLTNKTEHCFAINGLLAYTDSLNLLNYRNSAAPKSIGYFARDLSAAITSANVLQKDKFADNRTNKIFVVLQKRLQLLVLTCQGLAADHQLDYQGFTERIIDLDILNGFSSRKRSVLSDHDPINVGSDIKLHISAILN